MTVSNFYVYEHWRPDTGECFYVGKGHGRRAYQRKSRNQHWRNIVAKLEAAGLTYDVRIVSVGLTEHEAFDAEARLISHWRESAALVNMTSGGEGATGRPVSAATRRKIGEATAKKLLGNKNSLGCRHTAERRARNSAAKLGNKHRLGQSPSAVTREKIRAALMGRTHSEETRRKMSESQLIRVARTRLEPQAAAKGAQTCRLY